MGRIAATHGRFSCIRQMAPMCTRVLNIVPWARLSPHPKQHLEWLVPPFLHSSQHRILTLYNGPPHLPQNCLFAWGIWTPSNTWFLGSTHVHTPVSISIGSSHFMGLTIMTDTQTAIDCIYVVLWCSLIIVILQTWQLAVCRVIH